MGLGRCVAAVTRPVRPLDSYASFTLAGYSPSWAPAHLQRLQRRKRSGIRMTELTFSDKYADAFWRLVPIPALLIVAAIAVALRPIPLAIAGLIALAWASLFAEVLVWRHLRHRWAHGLAPESVGQTLEELGRPAQSVCPLEWWDFEGRAGHPWYHPRSPRPVTGL